MRKKRKHEENGMTSKPRDEMPLERSSDASPYSLFSDALKQFDKHIQVKVNTDELVQKLEQRVHNLEEKVKVDKDEMVQKLEQTESLEQRVKKLEDKVKRNKSKEVQEKERISKIKEDHRTELNEFKEDLRTELNEYKEELRFEFHQEIRKLEDKVENRSTKCFSVLKQDFKKELEVKDEPSLGIQEEGRAKVHHLNESPSLRSQPHQSETTRFKLKIKNEVAQVVYKGKPIRTNDSEHITVVLYDGDNPIAPDHHLASAKVQLVVVDGDEPQGFLSKYDLQKKKMIPRNANNQNLVKNGIFALVDGKCRHKGVTVTDNSNRRDFRLGVMIEGDTNERVLGELSNTFKVQEAKTEKDRAKRNTDDSTEDLLRYTPGQVHMTNKNGQGQRCSLQQAMPNFPIMANPPLHQAYMVQGAHKRHSSGSVGSLMANGLPQQGTSQLGNRGQVQQFQTTGQGQHYQTAGSMLSLMQNQSQITYGLTAGNGSAGPPSNNLQLYNTQQSVQLANYGQGRPHMLATHNNVPPPLCPFVVTPSQITYAPVPGGMVGEVSGNGPGGEHIVDRVPRQNATQPGVQMDNHGNGSVDPRPVEHLQQYPTQQGINGQENYGQGRQHNSVTRTFAFSHAEAENGAGRVPQQNATQQGVQLDNHGQGQQHNSVTQTFAVMPSQTFANAAAGNGPGGELGVDDVLQQNATQQGVQLDNHRSDLGLGLGLSTHNIPTGDVIDTLDETLRQLRANPTAPDDPECSRFFHDPVAAHQGGPSAGTRQWSTNQPHMDYSSGMQYTFHPATEDGGSTVSAPSTAAPAPEDAQMDFTQPTAMASWKP